MTVLEFFEKIGFQPHALQIEVLQHPARFKVCSCGRRWGKTLLASAIVAAYMFAGKRVWWVAPEHKLALEGYHYLRNWLKSIEVVFNMDFRSRLHPSPMFSLPQTGGMCEFRSIGVRAQSTTLVGAGLDLIVADEVARIAGFIDLWESDLRPTLMDKLGKALFISTPRGHNDFHELFERAQEQELEGWKTFQFPSRTNPFLDPDEIQLVTKNQPEKIAQQELEACFISRFGNFFPRVVQMEPVKPFRAELVGFDYADGGTGAWIHVAQDFKNRIIAVDEGGGQGISYAEQKAALKRYTERDILVVADSRIPKPIFEDLEASGIVYQKAVPNRKASQEILREWLSEEKAGVSVSVPILEKQLRSALISPKDPGDLTGADDYIDAFRYGFHAMVPMIEPWQVEAPTIDLGINFSDLKDFRGKRVSAEDLLVRKWL